MKVNLGSFSSPDRFSHVYKPEVLEVEFNPEGNIYYSLIILIRTFRSLKFIIINFSYYRLDLHPPEITLVTS